MGYSRIVLGSAGWRSISMTPRNAIRLVAFEKNTSGYLAGTTDRRSLYGTPSLREYISARRQQKEKENKKKPPEQSSENKIWYEPYDPNEAMQVSNFLDTTGYDIQMNSVIGNGQPNTDGEGWSLIFSGSFEKQNEDGSKTFASGKSTLEGDSDSKFKITSVNDRAQVKLPTHPLENGMVKHDHKVIQPKTLRVTGWVKSKDSPSFDDFLRASLAERSLGAYFTLFSPWKNRTPVYLQSFTSRANTQRYDVFEYVLDLTELLIATSVTDKTDKAELTSSNNKGAQGAKK